jgi:hypothetical protein
LEQPTTFLDGEPFYYGRPSERKLCREIEPRLKINASDLHLGRRE